MTAQPCWTNVHGDKSAYPYQRTGVEFALATSEYNLSEDGVNVLIADAMGLGKTIQGLLILRESDSYPALIIVKGVTVMQWMREHADWICDEFMDIFPITSSQQTIPRGIGRVYVISMDLLGKAIKMDDSNKPQFSKLGRALEKLKIETLIVDECHSFKNLGATRTKALLYYIKTCNPTNKIFLSGTPIKNRASEFFVPLHILAPYYFPTMETFKRQWLIEDENGRWRLNPHRIEKFKELTGKWILRREKREVLTDLPPRKTDHVYLEIDDEDVKDSYNHELDLFENAMNATGGMNSVQMLGWLTKLRRITGEAKAAVVLDYIREFLENNEDTEKLAVGIHHKSVRDTLYNALHEYRPLKMSGEDNNVDKDRINEEFKKPDRRLLILNELAGGVGLNIQHCWNAALLERQWNPADEEQFISRFERDGQKNNINITYFHATGTIDEYFDNMCKQKAVIFGEAVTNWEFTSDVDSMQELARQVVSSRL